MFEHIKNLAWQNKTRNSPITKIARLIQTPRQRILTLPLLIPIINLHVKITIPILRLLLTHTIQNTHGTTNNLIGIFLVNFYRGHGDNVDIVICNVVLVGFYGENGMLGDLAGGD
jgi:hypothetical protein